MPAHRRGRYACAYADRASPVPRERKPRKSRKDMSEEEKAQADAQREQRKTEKENKARWEASLVPWVKTDFRWKEGTIAMYKNDAKSQFGLTEQEILTLPHESITMSRKTFYSLKHIKALAERKFDAGVRRVGMDVRGQPLHDKEIRTFEKFDFNLARKLRLNWSDNEFMPMNCLPGFEPS